ncbi:hypothetical protein HH682_12100 [Rosenbergiella sp. S61]|uniref:Uncharacterized protein n=1 Tax=Rosenbergiella gaditana TaxID=2726987 RepID=A0ABS5SYL8_9GAMM|nr:hypothetical protein [Rosenbergiella gaditana]MBT0725144.1 hypothetical protein [Rosenbergiella gaditana]
MKVQVAHLYDGNQFMGYGLAVNGEVIDGQASIDISSNPEQIPTATVVFHLDAEMTENPVRVDLYKSKCQL